MKTITDDQVRVMMIVPFFNSSMRMGGAEFQAFRLAKELKKNQADVCIVAWGDGKIKSELVEGIQIYWVHSVLDNMASFFKKKLTRKKDIQIKYTHGDDANFAISGKKNLLNLVPAFTFLIDILILLRKKGKNCDIIYSPMMEWMAVVSCLLGKWWRKEVVIKDSTMNGTMSLLRYPFGNRMQKFVAHNGNFVAMTKIIRKNYLEAGIPAQKIFDIPNGVVLPNEPDTLRTNKNKFVFVGNLYQQPAKGVDVLMKAWKLVIRNIPQAQLYIIGDGHLDGYTQYAEELGIEKNIHFLGKQSQFQHHLIESSAFILPSRREGMSNALLEAMALGVTCIATDISGNQDLIQNKVNGLLIPVEDIEALAHAVDYINEHPREAASYGIQARKTIAEAFTLEVVSRKYFQIFTSLKREGYHAK
ncbi:MAG TPA: glycosyltransferase family 4 protein [Cyclobacteriaceae bacterium]|jgi:glycosyltransferase involved in cell wall biosynthesis|nr:glycosyltransferase family 4 protein [Cyclobacteriaceae bacterium]